MILAQAVAQAIQGGLARLDAQLLLLHALGRTPSDRAWLLAHDGDPLDAAHEALYRQWAERRGNGEPLAYITGHKEFFGLQFQVDKRVLVPRPDTETLVDWALERLGVPPTPGRQSGPGSAGGAGADSLWVVDLGTGSGAIALSIKYRRPDVLVDAVDASAEALTVAAANAKALDLPITLRHGSWLTGTSTRYDLIVANPPYIADTDPHLPALSHEPTQALAAGPDGLDDIRAICSQAAAHLKPGGWLLLEHGWQQAQAVRGLLQAAGLSHVGSRRDLAGIERCSGGQWLELG